jgi:hypothetical protein
MRSGRSLAGKCGESRLEAAAFGPWCHVWCGMSPCNVSPVYWQNSLQLILTSGLLGNMVPVPRPCIKVSAWGFNKGKGKSP